ncbi:response regulator [Opitutus terrae]|uniref:Two component transcriptional regulator, LuxR family n=1 Tax=Opitutus terrae (strain DSM 11246 / JCM 15787 / PB90-1) TaxID=452637 RepID=B1ZTJ2_OPITP|nr:response regulator transcription factor [Opitutus terrae]ACB73937.1 two component transcriptional regulator, LuxR family [Opitutus terrae PB90-1]
MSASAPTIRVLVVDDSALVRMGLRSVLGTHGAAARIVVAGEADSVASAVSETKRLKPDVVLLDIRLPDGSGLHACREIKRMDASTRVLILTSVATDELIQEAVMAGAQGYLMKEIDPDGLTRAIVDAFAGKSVLTPEITARVLQLLREGPPAAGDSLAVLSAQERRVLALVADGLTNKEVAEKLRLSDNTVKNYLVSVFEKLQVKRRSQAAAVYVQASRPTPPQA